MGHGDRFLVPYLLFMKSTVWDKEPVPVSHSPHPSVSHPYPAIDFHFRLIYNISKEDNSQSLMKDFLQQVYNTKIKMVSEKNQKKEERNQKVAPKEKKGSCGCC